MVTGTIPSGTAFAGLNSNPPNQAFSYNSGAGQVEWMGNLAPGEHRILTYAVAPTAGTKVGDMIYASAGVTHSGVTMEMNGMTMIMGEYSLYLPGLHEEVGTMTPSQ